MAPAEFQRPKSKNLSFWEDFCHLRCWISLLFIGTRVDSNLTSNSSNPVYLSVDTEGFKTLSPNVWGRYTHTHVVDFVWGTGSEQIFAEHDENRQRSNGSLPSSMQMGSLSLNQAPKKGMLRLGGILSWSNISCSCWYVIFFAHEFGIVI